MLSESEIFRNNYHKFYNFIKVPLEITNEFFLTEAIQHEDDRQNFIKTI